MNIQTEICLKSCRIALKRKRIERREKEMLLAKINDCLRPAWQRRGIDNQSRAAGEREPAGGRAFLEKGKRMNQRERAKLNRFFVFCGHATEGREVAQWMDGYFCARYKKRPASLATRAEIIGEMSYELARLAGRLYYNVNDVPDLSALYEGLLRMCDSIESFLTDLPQGLKGFDDAETDIALLNKISAMRPFE